MKSSETLVKEFLNGDNSAFTQLMKQEECFIKKLLFVHLNGNIDDINDVQQEVLLALYHQLKRFRFQSSFKSYLYRFVKNKAVDFIRKQGHIRRINDRVKKLEGLSSCYFVVDPEEELLKNDSCHQLYQALALLGDQERDLILLKDIENMSILEISEVTGLRAGTVKSRLHRCRKKLFLLLEDYYENL